MQKKNYYILLGVNSNASFEAIRTAYRNLAKKYHPDKNPGSKVAEEHFKEIQQAYATLSNPEKRKNYDLKNLYGTVNTKQKQYTPYTGYANQNAQQQAQQKRQGYSKRKTQTSKYNKTESNQILVSIGIAFILLYFIISYTGNKSEKITLPIEDISQTTETQKNETQQQTMNEKTEAPTIGDFDSPYSNFFGEGIVNEEIKNNIIIHNSNESEAIICLVENKKPRKTIRNRYLNIGMSLKMENIPNGEYFLKVYYGTNWDTAKTFINNGAKGGFKNEISFVELNTDNNILKMNQKESPSNTSFSSYEIGISPNQKKNIKIITAEQFFK